jgi:predicted adenine nucleotide alpha hydrolase (AANH) superfamily ATPase
MKALLHICCAPCAIYPLTTPFFQAHDITGFFYNPNIHPYAEYIKRREALVAFADTSSLTVSYESGYQIEDFFRAINGQEDTRCARCYRLRLEKTAQLSHHNGFAAFSSTLLYSKYQNHELIREIGEEIAATWRLTFLYEDFRKGWQAGIEESKRLGLYRQRYCGCLYSERERFYKNA